MTLYDCLGVALNRAGQWTSRGIAHPWEKDETVKKLKNTKHVYASILGHLDMSYMQHILNIPYLFESNKS